MPSYNTRYSKSADKVFGAELVIRDVCVKCNNGVLSKLDSYICDLFDRYFHRHPQPNTTVRFEYSFDLLLRWLLKISYNSARTTDPNTPLRIFREYILGTAPYPSESVSLALDIVPPVEFITRGDGIKRTLTPDWMRCGEAQLVPSASSWCIIRFVTLNAFHFLVLVTPVNTVKVDESEIRRVLSSIPGHPVYPNRTHIDAPVGKPSISRMHMHHFEAKKDLYDAHSSRSKGRKKPLK
ncbi:hypothetical protein [Corallococcus aberystwythensis]|uniref:hypothetical protein n=1 Tax=Corallococcus aberystwythensis TaxID=2316722 RepID=UPI0011C4645A|nr:hypothetical protein [Corallococcus aberystwythensis]